MDVGARLLAALLAEGSTVSFHMMRLSEDYFIAEERDLFFFVKSHAEQYGKLPSQETVKAKFKNLPKAPEPAAYYLNQVEERFKHRTMNASLKDANEFMKMQDVGSAIMRVDEAVQRVKRSAVRSTVSDFGKDGFDMVLAHYWATLNQEQVPGLWFGWPKFDAQCEGLGGGDLVSVVGRPGMGKTFLTLKAPLYTWQYRQGVPLYVSMEMSKLEIMQRLVAMFAHYGIKAIQSSNIATFGLKELTEKMKKAKMFQNPFYVVDGTVVKTPEDIEALVAHLRPTSVVIDSAYKLGNKDKRLKKGERIDANVDYLTTNVYRRYGIPGYQSYQLNRGAAEKIKKGKEDEVDLEDIYYSDAIGQESSIVLGLFEEDSIETMMRRKVSVLKGRRGQTGEFFINWLFDVMNFDEIDDDGGKAEQGMEFV